MNYNIFKIADLNNLKEKLLNLNYIKSDSEIISGNYKLNLYWKEEQKIKLGWEDILIEFKEKDIPKRSLIAGIIICMGKVNNYAITYGTSSFTVQKFCDKNFGFDFVKRLELTELKRMSSLSPQSTKNSSITTFKNTKTFLFDSGENITSLSAIPQDNFFGTRIDIGKSIKLKIKIDLNDIYLLLDEIEKTLEKQIINKIPLLVKISDNEQVKEYEEKMYFDLERECNNALSNYTQFTIKEFEIVGSSIYFEEEHTKIIKIGKKTEIINLFCLKDLYELSKKIGVSIKDIISNGKIIHIDDNNKTIYSEEIKKYITYEIPEKNAFLYENEWFYYNQDYINLLYDEIKSINIKYDTCDDYSENYINEKKLNEKDYREKVLNRILADKYKGKLLDRDLFIKHYENEFFNSQYKIEIADLLIDDAYISLKIGRTQSLSYCVDQSLLSARLINRNIIKLEEKGLPVPKKYILWLYFENNTIFSENNANILKIVSIMLLCKICDWSKNIKEMGKIPEIYVNKFFKNKG